MNNHNSGVKSEQGAGNVLTGQLYMHLKALKTGEIDCYLS